MMNTLADDPPTEELEQFFVTGGALSAGAQSYVERAADHELLASLKRGEFCYVLTSRQMGKSSLRVRAAARLRDAGILVANADLTLIGNNLTAEQWYDSLLTKIAKRLVPQREIENYWDEHQRESPLARWAGALRDIVLPNLKAPLVVFIDEIDYVLTLPFSADEFFAAIREFYIARADSPRANGITFCLLGVATPAELIRNPQMTPFNIGRAIQLADFSVVESQQLGVGLNTNPEIAARLISRITYWTGGHPYLTQRLAAQVASENVLTPQGVDGVCDQIFLAAHAREHDSNLGLVQKRLAGRSEGKVGGVEDARRAELLDLYAKVYRGSRVVDDDLNKTVNELRLSGIVRVAEGFLKVRNEIYRQVFNLRWVDQNMPQAELRRQRDAYFRGVRRVATAAVVVIAAVGWIAGFAWQQRRAAVAEKERATSALATANDEKLRADNAARIASDREEEIASNLKTTQERVGDLLRAMKPLLATQSKARERVLEAAQRIHHGVSPEAAKRPDIQLSQVDLLREYSAIYSMLGNPTEAIRSATDARRIVEDAIKARPQDIDLNLRLVECDNTLGNAILGERDPASLERKSESELNEALDTFKRGLDRVRTLQGENPDDKRLRQLEFACLSNLGDVASRLGRSEQAKKAFLDAHQVIEDLRKIAPGDPNLAEDLAVSFDQVGDLYFGREEFDNAQQQFQESRRVREELVRTADEKEKPRREARLAFSLNKLGKVASKRNKLKDATTYYGDALRIREKIVQADPKDFETKRQLAFSYNNIGSVYDRSDRFADALQAFKDRLRISRELLDEDPSNADWRNDYCEGLNIYADMLTNISDKSLHRWSEALTHATEAVNITNRSDPRYLLTLAQLQRLNGNAREGVQTLAEAEQLLAGGDTVWARRYPSLQDEIASEKAAATRAGKSRETPPPHRRQKR